ncbi:hypothetical protein BN1051_03043 [Arthrobacter saudimassiliensis]|uniref:Uncharacterized protein n=1 Tax=Arthrobacter saudimassiliensis TaxID=1461584 RepID=A0A078MXZ2_9MICC|nr:hypothetical protein BN1051_03043 [Arthrobacter saudimassiliensis]
MCFETQTLSLKRNGTTAREGIKYHGQFTIIRLSDLCTRLL